MTNIEKAICDLLEALAAYRKDPTEKSWWNVQMAAREIPSKDSK